MIDKEAIDAAIAEITARPMASDVCWGQKLSAEAAEFLEIVEQLRRDGERVRQRIVADKFEELYGYAVTEGQIGNHLTKRCGCKLIRDY